MRAVLYFGLLAGIFVAPALFDPEGSIVGDPRTDTSEYYWGFWWFYHCLVERGELPGWTRLLRYPDGGFLYFIDPLNALLSVPLQAMVGLSSAYNLVVLIQLTFSCTTAYLLARRITGDPAASLVAGTAFGFSSFALSSIHNGNTGTLSTGWIPLYFLLLEPALREGGWRRCGAAAAVFALATMSSLYFGCFLGVSTLLFAHHRWRQGEPGTRGWWPLLVLGTWCLALATPSLYALLYSMAAGAPLVENRAALPFEIFLGNLKDSDLVGFFHPGPTYKDLPMRGNWFIHGTYLGWVSLLLAGAAVLSQKCRWPCRPFWLALAGIFFLLSLGPFLVLGGEVLSLGDRPLPLPYLALVRWVPGFDELMFPYRFSLMAVLALAVLAAGGAGVLLTRVPPRARGAAGILLSLLVVAELAYGSPVPYPLSRTPVRVPEFYHRVGRQPGRSAVVDLPFAGRWGEEYTKGTYYRAQVVHQRPIPYYINTFVPELALSNSFLRHLFRLEFSGQRRPPREPSPAQVRQGLEQLRRAGIRYLALHPDFVRPAVLEAERRFLSRWLGPPISRSQSLEVYGLGPDGTHPGSRKTLLR